MKVLIVPDKFKGTLTAEEAADAMANGWKEARPGDELELLPMSDGGDGFGDVMARLLGGTVQESKTLNAAHEPIEAAWWWVESTGTAIVESARVIGLAMLPPGKLHPFELDTLGLGKMLKQIFSRFDVKHLIVGIGGSATNDGGFGMARGLGFVFRNGRGSEITRWTELVSLETIVSPTINKFPEVRIATDVQNALLGVEGATRIYGPQKGLKPEDFPKAEAALQRLTEIVSRDVGAEVSDEPGTGAAGGLGYGLRALLNSHFESGFDLFARLSNLKHRIKNSDLVITGEGCIDRSSAMGKGAGAVGKLANQLGKKCVALAGMVKEKPAALFDFVAAIYPDVAELDEAQQRPKIHLKTLARKAAETFPAFR